MVESSFMGLFQDAALARPILHYDYERDKGDGYPEAHLQVCASSGAWDDLCAATRGDDRPFERLHLPVGGQDSGRSSRISSTSSSLSRSRCPRPLRHLPRRPIPPGLRGVVRVGVEQGGLGAVVAGSAGGAGLPGALR